MATGAARTLCCIFSGCRLLASVFCVLFFNIRSIKSCNTPVTLSWVADKIFILYFVLHSVWVGLLLLDVGYRKILRLAWRSAFGSNLILTHCAILYILYDSWGDRKQWRQCYNWKLCNIWRHYTVTVMLWQHGAFGLREPLLLMYRTFRVCVFLIKQES